MTSYRPIWRGRINEEKDALALLLAADENRIAHVETDLIANLRGSTTSGDVFIRSFPLEGIEEWRDEISWALLYSHYNTIFYGEINEDGSFKNGGLTKQITTIPIKGRRMQLIAYCTLHDRKNLKTIHQDPDLKKIGHCEGFQLLCPTESDVQLTARKDPITPAYTGRISTPQDAIYLFEAAIQGIVHSFRATQAPQMPAQPIEAGDIFIRYWRKEEKYTQWRDRIRWTGQSSWNNFRVCNEEEGNRTKCLAKVEIGDRRWQLIAYSSPSQKNSKTPSHDPRLQHIMPRPALEHLKDLWKSCPRGYFKKTARAQIACTHCRKSRSSCGNERPCQRCINKGLEATCEDAKVLRHPRKEDKKFLRSTLSDPSFDVEVDFGNHNGAREIGTPNNMSPVATGKTSDAATGYASSKAEKEIPDRTVSPIALEASSSQGQGTYNSKFDPAPLSQSLHTHGNLNIQSDLPSILEQDCLLANTDPQQDMISPWPENTEIISSSAETQNDIIPSGMSWDPQFQQLYGSPPIFHAQSQSGSFYSHQPFPLWCSPPGANAQSQYGFSTFETGLDWQRQM